MRSPVGGQASVVMATKCSSSASMTTDHMGHGRSHRGHRHAYENQRKSAVELLEASKREYVKSVQVLNHRQELKHPENLSIGNRDIISIDINPGKTSPIQDTLSNGSQEIEESSNKSPTLSAKSSSKQHSAVGSPTIPNKSALGESQPSCKCVAVNQSESTSEVKGDHSNSAAKPKTPPKPPPRKLSDDNKTPVKGAAKPSVPPRPSSAVKSPPVPGPKPAVIQATPGKPLPPPRTVFRVRTISVPSDDQVESVITPPFAAAEMSSATGTLSEDIDSEQRPSPKSSSACVMSMSAAAGDGTDSSRQTAKEERNSVSFHSDTFLKPLRTANNLSTSVGVLVERKRSPLPKPRIDKQLKEVDLPPRRPLHRSQSDLSSCRHSRTDSDFSDLSSRLSRTSTEVERFFNEMGIDRSVLEPMRKLCETKQKDLDSMSSLASLDGQSLSSQMSNDRFPMESEQDLSERDPGTMSVVERNARIIKWLCNVKKARTVVGKPAKSATETKEKS